MMNRGLPRMFTNESLRRITTLVAAGTIAAMPLAVKAQDIPSYATHEETIKGTIVSIDGQFGLTVRDEHGLLDKVTLHQGTIINPTGLTLAPGQSVTILGKAAGSSFAANEIDTPYDVADAGAGAAPYYNYAAPYDAGYPYAYGYGAGPYYNNSALAFGVGVGGYYPGFYGGGYYPGGYYQPVYYPHGYYSHGYNGHGVPAPYHTYPYHNPPPPASGAIRPSQSVGGYRGFGSARSSGGSYRGFSGSAGTAHMGGMGVSGGMGGHR